MPLPVPMPVPMPVPVPVQIQPTPTAIPPPAPLAIEAPLNSAPVSTDNIFAGVGQNTKDLDVTSIITKRLNAMRKLQENPMDSEAIKAMYRTQKDVRK